MTNDLPLQSAQGLKELLRALAQIGHIAEAMLRAEQAEREPAYAADVDEERATISSARAPAVSGPERACLASLGERAGARQPSGPEAGLHKHSASSRPLVWRGSPPAVPRPFFTRHAADRLHGSYGVAHTNMAQTMAALSHQIHGTHLAGLEAVNLGRRLLSDGASGTLWAVEIFHQVGFVVTDEDGIIVSVLPRDETQLSMELGPRRAALEVFRSELRARYADPIYLARYQRRSPASG